MFPLPVDFPPDGEVADSHCVSQLTSHISQMKYNIMILYNLTSIWTKPKVRPSTMQRYSQCNRWSQLQRATCSQFQLSYCSNSPLHPQLPPKIFWHNYILQRPTKFSMQLNPNLNRKGSIAKEFFYGWRRNLVKSAVKSLFSLDDQSHLPLTLHYFSMFT